LEPWGASELQVKSGEVYIGSGELELAQGGVALRGGGHLWQPMISQR